MNAAYLLLVRAPVTATAQANTESGTEAVDESDDEDDDDDEEKCHTRPEEAGGPARSPPGGREVGAGGRDGDVDVV